MKGVYQRLAKIEGGVVLDAATGRGEFINTIKSSFKSYAQIVGVDYSEKSVSYAQKLFPENDIEIYRMNLEDLSFEDNHFDTITIANSMHHLENPHKVLLELKRVLKPGGMFLIAEMYRDGDQTETQAMHIRIHHWLSAVDRLGGISHNETFVKHDIEAFADFLKLKKREVFDYYFPVDNPKVGKNCEAIIKNCQENLKRLELREASQELINEGKDLIKRITDIGCASASRLMIIGFK